MSTINEPIWITKDGDEIKISKMTDRHLENTIKHLEKTFEDTTKCLELVTTRITNRKIANILKDILNDLEDIGPSVVNSTYNDLIKELNKRKQEKTKPNELKTLYILLEQFNDYDQHGGYFAGAFEDLKEAVLSVDHIGRKNKEYKWYEIKEVEMNKVYKNKD